MDFVIAAPAFTVDDLFVGEDGAARVAPIDGGFFLIGKPALIEQLEKPLRPTVIVGVASYDFAVPIVREAHQLHLSSHFFYVGVSPIVRTNAAFYRRSFGRQSECIKSLNVQNVKVIHPLEPSENITDPVHATVSGMDAFTAGIWEHFQTVKFFLVAVFGDAERIFGEPFILPVLLDRRGIVFLHVFASKKSFGSHFSAPPRHRQACSPDGVTFSLRFFFCPRYLE